MRTATWFSVPVPYGADKPLRTAFWPTAYLFEGNVNYVTGEATSLFSRNLVVTDTDLTSSSKNPDDQTRLGLRGRDLRFATLDRSNLSRADLTGANLAQSHLTETDLREAFRWYEAQRHGLGHEFLEEASRTFARIAEESGRVTGFIIAGVQDAPPVFAPGGKTVLVDDFAVVEGASGDAAALALLDAVMSEGRARGAVQLIAIGAAKDARAARWFEEKKLHVASQWWTRTLSH